MGNDREGRLQRAALTTEMARLIPGVDRANEILKLTPLGAGWIIPALRLADAIRSAEAYAVWGGIPRYWELAADHVDFVRAIEALVLSPLGALFEEASRLLLDDLRDTAQAASILGLIGQGCHRLSEIAARLGKPATSLSRAVPALRVIDESPDEDVGVNRDHRPARLRIASSI